MSDKLYEGWSIWDGKKWELWMRDMKGCIIGNKWRKRYDKRMMKGQCGVWVWESEERLYWTEDESWCWSNMCGNRQYMSYDDKEK